MIPYMSPSFHKIHLPSTQPRIFSSSRLVNSTNDFHSYREHLGRMSSRANLHSNVAANYVPLSVPSSTATSSLARDIVKRRPVLKCFSMHRYIHTHIYGTHKRLNVTRLFLLLLVRMECASFLATIS